MTTVQPGWVLRSHAAIANAIEDAVGIRVTELPLTPERVLAAIDAGKGSRNAA